MLLLAFFPHIKTFLLALLRLQLGHCVPHVFSFSFFITGVYRCNLFAQDLVCISYTFMDISRGLARASKTGKMVASKTGKKWVLKSFSDVLVHNFYSIGSLGVRFWVICPFTALQQEKLELFTLFSAHNAIFHTQFVDSRISTLGINVVSQSDCRSGIKLC